MPSGEETDFILVSCAGALLAEEEPLSAAAVLSHKRKGEQALRHSGLGYTIIRPGPLLEEPGGYKALVFDQVALIFPGLLPFLRLSLSVPFVQERTCAVLQDLRLLEAVASDCALNLTGSTHTVLFIVKKCDRELSQWCLK